MTTAAERAVLEFHIARRLESPNRTRGHHWSRRHRDTQQWELEVIAAAPWTWRTWSLIEATETKKDRNGTWRIVAQRRKERRRVTVIRRVPSRRNFCRDEDNLAFTAKSLQDALVRLGLLYDDSRAWLDRVILEEVAPDGRDSTVIQIERLA